ncbi:DUF2288 domain-containing protein [Alloalcanivorax gelatiniphagus]|uniref:DUF2288 domain-containing protein n=1 Tax=Alloalcanivorax gelatiniphagus TaxID=1194167 RepID=A0ABY2XM71_9GAMM|nr:DUF2288 domain-containing protein [Alloalcanivorax gelatiniphagus]TMW13382.1 DUF2288 domain-containing protein [Alloalcanivorax gelatiniphagus]
MAEPDDTAILKAKLNQETARAGWRELQPFFARGQTVAVAGDLDLIEVAVAFAEDRVEQIRQWRSQGRVDAVGDDQARGWFEADQEMWTLVVKPWVLVQPARAH